jgi:hypothetical protein
LEDILRQIPTSRHKYALLKFLRDATRKPAYFGDSVEAFEQRLMRVVNAKIELVCHESLLCGICFWTPVDNKCAAYSQRLEVQGTSLCKSGPGRSDHFSKSLARTWTGAWSSRRPLLQHRPGALASTADLALTCQRRAARTSAQQSQKPVAATLRTQDPTSGVNVRTSIVFLSLSHYTFCATTLIPFQ